MRSILVCRRSPLLGLGYQSGQFRAHRQGFEGAHGGPTRIAQRQATAQVAQGHEGQSDQLACHLRPIAGAKGQAQHVRVCQQMGPEKELSHNVGCFKVQPGLLCRAGSLGFADQMRKCRLLELVP